MTIEEAQARIAELEKENRYLNCMLGEKPQKDSRKGYQKRLMAEYKEKGFHLTLDTIGLIVKAIRNLCFRRIETSRRLNTRTINDPRWRTSMEPVQPFDMTDEEYEKFCSLTRQIIDILYENRYQEGGNGNQKD